MLTDAERERYGRWAVAVLPRAVAYARSLTGDPSRAEDLVQECLYRLLRKADAYDLERDGVRLLYTAISNLCINQATRRRELASLDASPVPVVDPAAVPPDLAAAGSELAERVRTALAGLPQLQRAAVELRAVGLSKAEMADALGVTPSHAGVLVHRGRLALAAAIGLTVEGSV